MLNSQDTFSKIPDDITSQPTTRIISGFWRRSLAILLDSIFLGTIGFILGFFLFDLLAQIGGYGRFVGFSIALVYFGLLNSSIGKGQTIGKKIMKIVVVGRDGEHITIVRSIIRYTILSAPWFLNGVSAPSFIIPSPIGYLVGFLVLGLGGASIYLFIFNRHTRQSLHDLCVKTFVVKASPQGEVSVSPVWKLHLIIVGIWFFVVILSCLISTIIIRKSVFPELLALQKSILSTGKVHMATAFVGKSWGTSDGRKWKSTYFHSNVTWKTRPEDYEAAAAEIASIVLSEYPQVMNKDLLAIKVIYGYDIGITRAWITHNVHHSPHEWCNILKFPLSTEQKINQLEKEVEAHLSQYNVDLRENVDDLFLLADIYLKEGRDNEAIELFEKALSVNSWRLEYQLKFARLLLKHGQKSKAIEKAKIVYQYAEEESLINEAKSQFIELGVNSLAEIISSNSHQTSKGVQIVIVPVGEVNETLLHEVKEELQKKMGIRYSIYDNEFNVGEIDRSYANSYLDNLLEKIKHSRSKEELSKLKSEINCTDKELEEYQGKKRFVSYVLQNSLPKNDYDKFKENLTDSEGKGQYDTSRLLSEIRKKFKVEKGSKIVGFLGITESDIFTRDYNYLFGWGRPKYGIVSYHRFRSLFNNAPPNRPRLCDRIVKQCISSSFFILDIKRCTNPTCARAYPRNLTEHDQKDTEICTWCKEQLKKKISMLSKNG